MIRAEIGEVWAIAVEENRWAPLLVLRKRALSGRLIYEGISLNRDGYFATGQKRLLAERMEDLAELAEEFFPIKEKGIAHIDWFLREIHTQWSIYTLYAEARTSEGFLLGHTCWKEEL